ncbi:MAG: molecular chaperone DnaJ [Deltaproteobacteria bacterium]
MATTRDYYEILGLQKGAADSEIKKAYRVLAKKYHPDVNQGDSSSEAKFKEINEAYEVLSNPDKKAKYDKFGHAGVDPNGFGGFGGFSGFEDMGFGGIGDIFESFFGSNMGFGNSARKKNGPQKGQDIKTYTEITFEEAAFGVEKELSINRYYSCEECEGTGSKKGTQPERCNACSGTGQIQYKTNTPFGQFVNVKACDKCKGEGKIITNPCPKCQGAGKYKNKVTLKVNIPGGIDNEQIISLRGEGEPGLKGGPAGDMYVVVTVKPHQIFKRQGFDVICDIPITFTQATLGSEIEVPTLDGKIKYSIPEGTQTGTVFKIKNTGIKNLRGHGRGDHYFKVNIEVPKRLNDKQKEALKKFAELAGDDVYQMQKSFLDKMKDALGM